MLNFDAPSSQLVIAELGKPHVRKRLHSIARWSTGSDTDAEDLVEDALARVLDPDDVPWVPEKGRFLIHMSFVMRQEWDRHMRKAASQREVVDTGLARDETTPSTEPSVDDELHGRRTIALWQSLMEEVLADIGDKHPRTRQVFDLAMQGIDEPEKQAERLECKVDEVYLALKTIKRHARSLLAARDLAEQRRMRDLQEKAMKDGNEANP